MRQPECVEPDSLNDSLEDAPSTASIETLRQRSRLLEILRDCFRNAGYWEVETPLLSHDVCVDRWLDPIAVFPKPGDARPMFLQTSPEFAMKRLLSSGADAIFQITHAFRGTERGPRHNPEFTIVEWYRTGATYHEQMDMVETLVRAVHGADVSPAAPSLSPERFRRVTYDEAFTTCFGQPVLALEVGDLQQLAHEHDIAPPESMASADRDEWLNVLLADRVEPWLTRQGAIFLYDYPASQAALARIRPGNPPVSERFELYLDGLEVCNGYQELTDAEELAGRMVRQTELRVQSGLSDLPTDSRLIAAMRRGFPECSGVALGLDRLIMWRLGAAAVDEVIPFPFERA